MSADKIWMLLTKKFNNELSAPELEELEALLRQNQEAFQLNELFANLHNSLLKQVSDEVMKQKSAAAIRNRLEMHPQFEAAMQQIIAADDMEGDRAHIRKNGKKIAVSVLACACLLAIVFWPLIKNKVAAKEPVAMNEVKTDSASRSTINLPDGSVVILNAGSKLSYNKGFGISTREIALTGEAYFDIHKNPDMPLVVHAGAVDIYVKGTTFNVKAYPGDSAVEAALLTGVIELVSKKDPERKILMRPNEKIIVTDVAVPTPAAADNIAPLNETIALDKIKRDPVDSGYAETAWIYNKLVFRSRSFVLLAHDLERRYNVQFQFEQSPVKDLVFSGSFTNETLEEALEALKITSPFKYTITGKMIYIKK